MRSASLERYYQLRHGRGARPTLVEGSRRDRLWLEPIADRVRESSGVARLTLDVQGMHCAGCVWVIEELFRREDGAESVLVNPALGRCELAVRPGFDLRHFVESVERFGYLFGPPGKESRGALDALVVRAGVTVALAANAMMFGIAQYFGLREEPLRTTMATLEVALAAAAVLVGGPTFFRAAWEGIRRGVLHLDLPIAVGLILSSIGTFAAFLRTGDASFADTLAVFVALMLVGRVLERGALERNRNRLLASEGTDGLFVRARMRDAGGKPLEATSIVRASAVRPGDLLVIATGEVVPVDAVAHGAATVSLDWTSGESKPVEIAAGERVPAGAVNASRRMLEVEALSDLASSGLLELLRREHPETADARTRGLFHKVSAVWVVSVLLVATATLLGFGLAGDWSTGLANATAVLVVTCPCAIGIATPLAYELAVGDLRRAGVLVRRSRTLDRLPEVDTVVFDKTGTLTTGHLVLRDPSVLASMAEADRRTLAGLVSQSSHPKSVVVRDALGDVVPRALEVEEIAGQGLRATVDGEELRLGRPAWAAPEAREIESDCDLVLSRDGRVVAALTTDEDIRHDAATEIAALRSRGFRVTILSGDRIERVRRVAAKLGLPVEAANGDQSPHDKAAWLEAHGRRALFVGDGINDALAAEAAFVSATPSLERPFLPAKSDFVFTDPGIAPVRWTLVASDRVRTVARRNLVFAALYNVFGAALAAAGVFHPWVAAVLMPASSLFVVGRTLLAFRESVHEGPLLARGVDAARGATGSDKSAGEVPVDWVERPTA
ncbi:MAG: cation-translocating P-type ATPase [Sandaracinaceae bacterium]